MLLHKTLVFFVFIVAYFNPVKGANILAFLPAEGRSHAVPFYPFFRELGAKGHNVTIFSYFPMKTPAPNVTSIIIETKIQVFSIGFANLRTYSRFFNWRYVHDELQLFFGQLVRDQQFQDFYHDPETKFDLVFVELYHMDGGFALGKRFNCPVIGLSVQPMLTIYHWLMSNPTTFSYIPHSYLPYASDMTLWQRSVNSLFGVFTVLYYNFVSIPAYQKHVDFLLAAQYAERSTPSIQELTRNVSMVFEESHFSCAHDRPHVPNVIDVAGIHIEKLQPLPSDIKTFMDEAEHGVIIVSLGTLIDPQMAGELGDKLLNTFKNLPQRVIWKWKGKHLSEGETGNLMIREWLPQLDILNHPKCRLFISHGGYHSVLETIYSGVPVLGLPFFTDQFYNMAYVTKLKIGKKIDPETNERELREAIEELLNDPEYLLRCKNQSEIFKDRPYSPMETAIFWTEHVLKLNGVGYLKSSAQDLYLYEYLLLDVILVLVLFVMLCAYIALFTFKKLVKIKKWMIAMYRYS